MAQISFYLDDFTAKKLNAAAKARNCSVSKYVGTLISARLEGEDKEEARKKRILEELRGAIDDPAFTEPPEIPWEQELSRRLDLL